MMVIGCLSGVCGSTSQPLRKNSDDACSRFGGGERRFCGISETEVYPSPLSCSGRARFASDVSGEERK